VAQGGTLHTSVRRQPKRRVAQARCVLAAIALLAGATACDNEVKERVGEKVTDKENGGELRRCRPEGPEGPEGQSPILYVNEDIESFAGCELLEGSLGFTYHVTDLSPLSSLKVIEGSISGGGYQTTRFSLQALHNLEIVGGDMHFRADNVTTFEGTKLHQVGGLQLFGVPELEHLRGLEKVQSFSWLNIMYNPKLQTLAGLDGLSVVVGDVNIMGNVLVPAKEVDALLARISVGGTIYRD
jgi:hypothetical protein